MDVRLPDGRIIKNVPDGMSRADLTAHLARNGIKVDAAPKTGVKGTGTYGLSAPKSDLTSSYLRGATFGGLDELSGLAGAAMDAVRSPFSSQVDFNPVKSYEAWKTRARQQADATDSAHPVAGTALELAGGLGGFKKAAIRAASLPMQMLKGTGIAAAAGGVSGFLGADGEDRVPAAASGSMLAAPFGALAPVVIPAVTRFARSVPALTRRGVDAMTGKTSVAQKGQGLARSLVAKAMIDDRITPRGAGEALQAANARGVPLALGDLGDNLRGFTGSLSRKPGKARTLVNEMVDTRQAQAGERIRGAIERDLGPVRNTFSESDALIADARNKARPFYDEAYAQPPISTPEIDAILATPAGRDAVRRAETIAGNERVDPKALGFALDGEGNVVLSKTSGLTDNGTDLVQTMQPERVPGYTTRSLDFTKRGLDDIVEAYRDPTSGRLNLDEYGRSVNSVRADLINEVDRLNPSYAKARAAYSGPAAANDALWKGKQALTATADKIERMTGRMNEFERSQFANGFRAALADAIDGSGGSADIVNKLLGTPRKRTAIARVFGGEDGLNAFLQTVADEKMAFQTYKGARLGSPTGERVAEDASLNSDLLGNGGRAVANAATGNFRAALWNGLNAVNDFRRFGAGQTAERARQEAAALLTETNPGALSESLREAMRQEAMRRASLSTQRRAGVAGAGAGGYFIGGAAGRGQ